MFECKIEIGYNPDIIIAKFHKPKDMDKCVFIGLRINENSGTIYGPCFNYKGSFSVRKGHLRNDCADKLIADNIDEIHLQIDKALKRWRVEKHL